MIDYMYMLLETTGSMFCTDVKRENLGLSLHIQIISGCRPGEFNDSTMATTLGKRKRRTAEVTQDHARDDSENSESSEVDAQELFRRHFEAKFKPLPVVKEAEKLVEAQEDDSEEESDWDGISEDEQAAVEVVEHTDAQSRMALMSKEELKVFMVCRSSTIHESR